MTEKGNQAWFAFLATLLDDIELREKEAIRVIDEINTPSWGMCMGAIDVVQEIRETLAEWAKT